ncbi:DMT family transporter [Cesiribacter andamanensis]|uniref:Putative permease n=1 Tax=Cesiribacter andamanensis AMV16 TaxID=1279009 RepID=M7NL67_9BACT|nr:DMT family transporter [Cesiribacter andamanensis]EMR02540.1 putative permease [Cesiribacter andamanensis AMV16]
MKHYFSPGIRYMLLASFLFSVMNLLVKLVPRLPAEELVFFRSVISLVICLVMLRRAGITPWGTHKALLIGRGAAGAVALITFFVTLQHIPLASAVTIQYLSPIFTTLLGVLLVRERVFWVQLLFFAMAFGGVLLVKGYDPRVNDTFLLLGICSAFFSGLAYNAIRRMGKREHPLVIVLYFPLVTLPITGAWLLLTWVQPQGLEWLYLLAIGVLTQFAQYYMTLAFQAEELSKVSSVQYMGILYALLFGWVFFAEHFTFFSYLGMLLVLLGVILNIWYKSRRQPAAAKG